MSTPDTTRPTPPTFRYLASGEVIRAAGDPWTLVRCRNCRTPVDTLANARRRLCRHCNLPAVVALARKALARGPRPAATMVRLICRLGLERHDDPKVRGLLDASLVRIDGRDHWALPQHVPLDGDDPFHAELAALLDQEAGGNAARA